MTPYEAKLILRIDSVTSNPRDIRRQYLKLMKENHPDNTDCTRVDPRVINEAYQVLLADSSLESIRPEWDADLAFDAYCERTTYLQYTFDDGTSDMFSIATGKYLWNPDAEDFAMLIRSIYEAAKGVCSREDPIIFHYLMQEFIDPLYALDKMEKPWIFKCRTNLDGHVFCAEGERLYVSSDDRKKSSLSFPDKSLHYIITPLMRAGAAMGRVLDGRVELVLTGKPLHRDYQAANEIISKRICS